MTIHDILAYAKENDVAVSAVLCSPTFNEKKGRVTKGNAVPHKDWNAKKRWEAKNTKTIHNKPAEAWMMDLRKMGLYVIDVDVKGDKKAKDVLLPTVWDTLMKCSEYVVETGSGGIHAYFKLPELEAGSTLKKSIGDPYFKQWFVNADDGDVDVIVDAIITEGSAYEYQGTRYTYTSIKAGGSIFTVDESPTTWEEITPLVLTTHAQYVEQNRAREEMEMKRPIEHQEIIDHVHNIPNTKTNWGAWYQMAQIIFNVLGDDGYNVFIDWSKQNRDHCQRAAAQLWKGLSERHNGRVLTLGTLLYQSKQANEEAYKRIRAKYAPLSYSSMKVLVEEDHFFVEEPTPVYARVRERDVITYTSCDMATVFRPMVCQSTNAKGELKQRHFHEIWSLDPYRRTYKRFGFYPDASKCPKDEFNTFVPAEASFVEEEKECDISPILAHFDIMGNHEPDAVNFLIDYFAQIVQQPDVLRGIAILLYGQEGSGKDILTSWIGVHILGRQQYRMAGDIKNLFKGFNSRLQNKFLLHCDEIDNATMKAHFEDFKRLVTDEDIDIEVKGKEALTGRNYARLFLTTNNRDAFMNVLSATGRREVLIESSAEKAGDRDYFTRLSEVLQTPGIARTFYNYLMKRDISQFHWTNRPKTKLYKEIRQASIHPIYQWIVENEETFKEVEGGQSRVVDWMKAYNAWAEENGTKQYSIKTFGLFLNEAEGKNCGITKQKPKNVSKATIDRVKVVQWLTDQKLIDPADPE